MTKILFRRFDFFFPTIFTFTLLCIPCIKYTLVHYRDLTILHYCFLCLNEKESNYYTDGVEVLSSDWRARFSRNSCLPLASLASFIKRLASS